MPKFLKKYLLLGSSDDPTILRVSWYLDNLHSPFISLTFPCTFVIFLPLDLVNAKFFKQLFLGNSMLAFEWNNGQKVVWKYQLIWKKIFFHPQATVKSISLFLSLFTFRRPRARSAYFSAQCRKNVRATYLLCDNCYK